MVSGKNMRGGVLHEDKRVFFFPLIAKDDLPETSLKDFDYIYISSTFSYTYVRSCCM